MRQLEYKFVLPRQLAESHPAGRQTGVQLLQGLGEDGWELVQVMNFGRRDIEEWVLVRPVDYDDWTPIAENINALPEPIREYIYHLETNADPAGMVAENTLLKDQTKQLDAMIGRLKTRQLTDEHLASIRRCFELMNKFAESKEINYLGMRRPAEEVLQDMYLLLAQEWSKTLKETEE